MRLSIIVPLLSLFYLFVAGCGSSLNIPTVEESERQIAGLRPLLDSLNGAITVQSASLPGGYDLISRTRISAVNGLLVGVTTRSSNDLHIDFLGTRPLWQETKSILGIQYTNYVDIDTGSLDIDLKRFLFTDFSNNIVNASIEIEGKGTVRASGAYAGVSARFTPQIQFYLNENIQFSLAAADSDYIRLEPVPKTVLLKTKITMQLLGIQIPYYNEIPLQTDQLIKPVLIPSAVRSEIIFPIPAARYGSGNLDFVKRFLRFSNSTASAEQNVLEYRSNIDFELE